MGTGVALGSPTPPLQCDQRKLWPAGLSGTCLIRFTCTSQNQRITKKACLFSVDYGVRDSASEILTQYTEFKVQGGKNLFGIWSWCGFVLPF